MKASLSVAVMAHPKRRGFVPELTKALDRPSSVVWDEVNDRWHTGRRAMLAYDPAATHHLVVQDDAIICQDLVAGLEKAIGHVPDGSPLCLYLGRLRPFKQQVQDAVNRASPDVSWLTMTQLHWGVGIVLPTASIVDMVTWCDTRTDIANYDRRISRWIQHQKMTVYYPWPSLVDHRISPSLVPGRGSSGRRAHRFLGVNRSALAVNWAGRVLDLPVLARNSPGRKLHQPPQKVGGYDRETARRSLAARPPDGAGGNYHDPMLLRRSVGAYLKARDTGAGRN